MEEDPVVQEIPVYLSQALSDNLYVYQYPVRPANRDWKDLKVIDVSVKPKNQLVRMEIELDIYSDNYCSSKGEEIALNTDGAQEPRCVRDKEKEKEKSPYFKHGVMDKIVYESSRPCVDTQHYAVAVLQDKELHITPIKGILQLRPSCSYYDKQDKKKTEKHDGNSDDEEKESDAQQVTVKFARAETEIAKKAREKSFATMSQKIATEPWYHASWSNSQTDQADLERLKLFSATTLDGSSLNLGAVQYIRALVPKSTEEMETAHSQTKSLQDHIKEVLIITNLLRLSEVRSLVRNSCTEAAFVTALSSAACCVRGLWAPRSEHLYGYADSERRAMLAAARDHILYNFTQHAYVNRQKMTSVIRLPPIEVLKILKTVAKYSPNGWELLLPPDTAFEAKYPEVVQRQNLYWEARHRQFIEMLKGAPKRQRKKSQKDSVSSDSMLSPKPRNNSISIIEEDSLKRHKNKGCGGKRTRHVSSSSSQDPT